MTTRLHGVEESISDTQACEREFQVPGDYISQPLHLCRMSQKPLFRYELMLFAYIRATLVTETAIGNGVKTVH